ncbi:hypothetical protein BGX23_002202 [Mortierella sp. AD031]|nr:hypothetical protein BGX23_002202 [Mortierella sp. AD031]
MRIRFRGAMKCHLVFDSVGSCGCAACNFYIRHETIRFIDDQSRVYAVMDMFEPDKVVEYPICTQHLMRMNLIPYFQRNEARSADMDLCIHGAKRDTKWLDAAIVNGQICKLSVEIFSQQPPNVYQQCYVRTPQQQQQMQQQQQFQQQQVASQQMLMQQYTQNIQLRNQIAQLQQANCFQLGRDTGAAWFL